MTIADSRKRTAETKLRRTRAALLRAARILFAERGWHATRVEDVARMAGVSQATAYNHFRTKYVLIGHVYAPLVRRIVAAVNQEIEDQVDPVTVLSRFFSDLADLARRRCDLTRALFAAMQEEGLKKDDGVAEDDLRGIVALPDLLAKLIDYGRSRGRLLSRSPSAESGYYYTNALLDRVLAFPEESARDTARIVLGQLLSDEEHEGGPADAMQALEPTSADDLSLVLTRLMSDNSGPQRRDLANDQLTREYLEAGLRLSARELAFANERVLLPYSDITEAAVIEEVNHWGSRQASRSTLHYRWPNWADYLVDLLAYSLWARYWQPGSRTVTADIISRAIDPVRTAREVSRQELRASVDNPAMTLSLVAAATVHRHPELRRTMGRVHGVVHEEWVPIYEEILSVNGLRLRPGIGIDEVVDIFAMLTDAAALRVHLDPASDPRQHELLSKAALAVLTACIDPGDGLSIEDVTRQLQP